MVKKCRIFEFVLFARILSAPLRFGDKISSQKQSKFDKKTRCLTKKIVKTSFFTKFKNSKGFGDQKVIGKSLGILKIHYFTSKAKIRDFF